MGTNAAYVAWYVNTYGYTAPRAANLVDPKFHRLWQMAVSVPIPNFHFTYPKKQILTTSANCGAASADPKAIKFTFGTVTDRSNFINTLQKGVYGLVANSITKAGEVVRLTGNSTASGYDVTITVMENMTANYTSGNATFEFYTPKLADNWAISHSALHPMGLRKSYPTELVNFDGKPFAQQLKLNDGSFDDTQKLFSTTVPNLQEYASSGNGLYYRIGCRYYIAYLGNIPASIDEATAGTIALYVMGCNTSKKMLLNYLNGDFGRYFLFNSYPGFTDWKSFEAIRDTMTNRNIIVEFINESGGERMGVDFGLDDIYLEHSAGFETDLGALLLTMAPDRDSLQITSQVVEEYITLANGDKFAYQPFGNPNRSRKYAIGCTFNNSNMDTYRKLKILESWQNDGYNLNLHTHMPELPEVLTGRMTLGTQSKGNWDFERVSFEFYFEEV